MSRSISPDGMPAIGEILGKYQILGHLGDGSVGVVYRAKDISLGRDVALKVLRRQFAIDAEVQSRFLDEARYTARLDDHPNIVSIYDVGQEHGFLYLAMQLHEGPSLANLLVDQGRLPLVRTVHIVSQVAAALDFAHRAGVIHRDVKPGNIMIGSNDQATLTDFGLAKVMSQSLGKTIVGTVMGTPHYMSPEQIKGETIGPASDIYSLGITVYQMLTGILPHDADSMAAVLYRQAHVELPPLRLLDQPRCAAPVDAVLRRALHKDPKRRWPSAQAFSKAFGDAVDACAQGGGGILRDATLVGAGLLLLSSVLALALRGGDSGGPAPTRDDTPRGGISIIDPNRSSADPPTVAVVPPTDTPDGFDVAAAQTPGVAGTLNAAATVAIRVPAGESDADTASGVKLATESPLLTPRSIASALPPSTRVRVRPSATTTQTQPPPEVTPTSPPELENPTDEPEQKPPQEPPTRLPPKPPEPPKPLESLLSIFRPIIAGNLGQPA